MKNLVFIGTMVLATSSFAIQKTAEFALRMNQAKVDSTTSKDQLKFHGGVIVTLPIETTFSFRTGGKLSLKDSQVEAGGITISASRMFLDIPATIQFGNENITGYIGFDLGLKLSSSCSLTGVSGSCTLTDEKSLVLQPNLGADFTVAPKIKVGFLYEFETEYSKNWKQSAFGAKIGYDF